MQGLKSHLHNKQLLKHLIKFLVWIPAILMAVSIFGFSGQTGQESSGLSRKAAVIIIDIAEYTGIVGSDEAGREDLIEKMQIPIRKGAHMSEYMILEILVALALMVWGLRGRRLFITAFVMVFLFACSDEFHQLFIPGRSGKITDVLVDSCGIMIGALIVWFGSRKLQKKWLTDKI